MKPIKPYVHGSGEPWKKVHVSWGDATSMNGWLTEEEIGALSEVDCWANASTTGFLLAAHPKRGLVILQSVSDDAGADAILIPPGMIQSLEFLPEKKWKKLS